MCVCSVSRCEYLYICVYTHTGVHVQMCVYRFVSVCTNTVYAYVYTCVCMWVCKYRHTEISDCIEYLKMYVNVSISPTRNYQL